MVIFHEQTFLQITSHKGSHDKSSQDDTGQYLQLLAQGSRQFI